MQLVPASASGCAGDGGPPRHGRGGRARRRPWRSPPLEAAAPGLMIAARVTLARKRSLIWLSKRCSRGAGLPGRTTIWRTAAGTPAAAGSRGTRRARGRHGGQDCGPAGFGSGQPFDVLRPGPVLAGAADRVHTGALRRVSDEELTGMIRAWRRLSSWATARELGAIAEFARRRPDEDPGPGMDGDVARRVRARRAASGPPGAAGQAGSAQAPPAGGVNPAAQAAQPGGVNPAAQAAQPGGANPAAQGAPAGGTAGANPAARGAPAAPATPAGGAGGATPAAQAPAAAPAGGANPAAAGMLAPGGGPAPDRVSRR